MFLVTLTGVAMFAFKCFALLGFLMLVGSSMKMFFALTLLQSLGLILILILLGVFFYAGGSDNGEDTDPPMH